MRILQPSENAYILSFKAVNAQQDVHHAVVDVNGKAKHLQSVVNVSTVLTSINNVTALPENQINDLAQIAICEDVNAGRFRDRTECEDIMD